MRSALVAACALAFGLAAVFTGYFAPGAHASTGSIP
jgi:hypothetical protein